MTQNAKATQTPEYKPTQSTMPIFTMRMAGYLMLNGYILLDVVPNRRKPKEKVFYFMNSPRIHESIQEYLSSKN